MAERNKFKLIHIQYLVRKLNDVQYMTSGGKGNVVDWVYDLYLKKDENTGAYPVLWVEEGFVFVKGAGENEPTQIFTRDQIQSIKCYT